jgi:hypothetical protein
MCAATFTFWRCATLSTGAIHLRVSEFVMGPVGFIDFHEKAFKLKMKFISLGGVRFGIGLPCGLGVVVQV